MNPSDALPQDFGMYYNGCWMQHVSLGVGRVQVINGKLYFEDNPGLQEPKQVTARHLSCWWPRPGAHNIPGENKAVYIARRAMRNMRKSAVGGDHYFIKWGSPHHVNIMWTLREGAALISMHEATNLLKKKSQGVAVSRDIILIQHECPDTYGVVFRGEESGTYQHGVYTPMFSDNPLTGRILRQLEERQ